MRSLVLMFFALGFGKAFAAANNEMAKVQAVADEWRSTYKYDKSTYEDLQNQIQNVIDTQALLEQQDLDSGLRAKLEERQKKSLQQIVNKGETTLPYLLREFSNVIAARGRDLTGLEADAKKSLIRSLRLREASLEAAINSIGLSAVPQLSDLHARALRRNADLLAKRIKGLLSSIVQRESLELEKMRLVGEGNNAAPTNQNTRAVEFATPTKPPEAQIPN